ncbi:MAG: hypothetical protein ACM3TN_09910, partial [Alphaproteobacteria bacterium]
MTQRTHKPTRGMRAVAFMKAAPKRVLLLGIAVIMMTAAAAAAHDDNRPAALREVDFEQKLNQQVPLDL